MLRGSTASSGIRLVRAARAAKRSRVGRDFTAAFRGSSGGERSSRLVTTTTRKSGGASFATVTDDDGRRDGPLEEASGLGHGERDFDEQPHHYQQQRHMQNDNNPRHHNTQQRWDSRGNGGNNSRHYGQSRNNNRGGWGYHNNKNNKNQRHHGRGSKNNQLPKKSGFLAESTDVPRIKWESFEETPFSPSIIKTMEQNGFEKVSVVEEGLWSICQTLWFCLIFAELKTYMHSMQTMKPSPIQAESWPLVMQGHDIISIAKTGSGKTCGFLIPAFERINAIESSLGLNKGRRPRYKYGEPHRPLALVLSPTRELARQINEEAQRYGRSVKVRSQAIYGGSGKWDQVKELFQNRPQCIVATPGRLIEMLEQDRICLTNLCTVVVDEAGEFHWRHDRGRVCNRKAVNPHMLIHRTHTRKQNERTNEQTNTQSLTHSLNQSNKQTPDRMLDMGFEPQLLRITEALAPSEAPADKLAEHQRATRTSAPAASAAISAHWRRVYGAEAAAEAFAAAEASSGGDTAASKQEVAYDMSATGVADLSEFTAAAREERGAKNPLYILNEFVAEYEPKEEEYAVEEAKEGLGLEDVEEGSLEVWDEDYEQTRKSHEDSAATDADQSNLFKVRQTLMFTATWPREVQDVARQFLDAAPVDVRVGDGSTDELTVNDSIKQEVRVVYEHEKPGLLKSLVRRVFQGSQGEMDEDDDFESEEEEEEEIVEDPKMIVFFSTKNTCDRVSRFFRAQGLRCGELHGGLQQNARTRTIDAFRNGKIKILFATDVAGRGIDVANVTHVVNYDFPSPKGDRGVEDYVHRIGRTGRAGKTGRAITYFTEDNKNHAERLVGLLRQGDVRLSLSLSLSRCNFLIFPLAPPPTHARPRSHLRCWQ